MLLPVPVSCASEEGVLPWAWAIVWRPLPLGLLQLLVLIFEWIERETCNTLERIASPDANVRLRVEKNVGTNPNRLARGEQCVVNAHATVAR